MYLLFCFAYSYAVLSLWFCRTTRMHVYVHVYVHIQKRTYIYRKGQLVSETVAAALRVTRGWRRVEHKWKSSGVYWHSRAGTCQPAFCLLIDGSGPCCRRCAQSVRSNEQSLPLTVAYFRVSPANEAESWLACAAPENARHVCNRNFCYGPLAHCAELQLVPERSS